LCQLFHKRLKDEEGKKGLSVEQRQEEIARIVIDFGLRLHREVGPGLLESVYETVLANRLMKAGLKVDRQRPIQIRIDEITFPDAFRADLLVEDILLIEIKSVEKLAPVHHKQALTYLRMMNLPLGLLINFGGETFREGVSRVMNNHVKP
jgi:GxxExxY protein